MQVTYIILAVLVYIFHILYKGDLSFILVAFLVLMPAALFVLLTIQAAMLKISVSCASKSAERGKPEVLKIVLYNPTIFPITACRLSVRYKSFFPPDKPAAEKYSVIVPVSQRTRESVTISFTPEHCGYVDISLKNVKISDMLGLTWLFKKTRYTDRITVLPAIFPFSPDMEKSFAYSADSDVFSSAKSGDDPSEIFQLREYRDGDSMNRIHWKLSSRGESFIVKELSKPINSRVLIICDLGVCKTSESFDMVLDMTATIASFFSGMQAAYTIAAVSEDNTLFAAEISDQESLLSALTELCCGSVCFGSRMTDEEYLPAAAELIKKGYSHILAITAETDKVFLDELSRLCAETKLTVFCTSPASVSEDKEDKNSDLVFTEIIYSDAEGLDEKCQEFYSDRSPYAE